MTRAQLLALLREIHAGRPDGGRSLLSIAYVRSAMTDAQLGQHFWSLFVGLPASEKARMVRLAHAAIARSQAPVPAYPRAA